MAKRNLIPIVLVAISGCADRSAPPSASVPHAVPPQAVNESTLGVVRVRLQDGVADTSIEALDIWLKDHRMESLGAAPLLRSLKSAGALTLLIAVPGDAALADDLGFYVGGTRDMTQTIVEDCLIESVGLVGGACSVVPIGTNWFFVGLTGDGVLEGASAEHAEEFSGLLEALDDASFTAVISPSRMARSIGLSAEGSTPGDYLASLLPSDDRRLARRARSFLRAADRAQAITVTTTAQGESVLAAVFESPSAAEAFAKACEDISKDLKLSLNGRVKRGEVSEAEAASELQFLESLRVVPEGRSVRLLP